MVVEQSFGFIPYRQSSLGYEFFLIEHALGHVTFPKGHVEGNETPIETALRELKEETGITDILPRAEKTFESEYNLEKNGTVIHKHVSYFLGRIDGEPRLFLQASEVVRGFWLPFSEAKTAITYDEDRKNLEDAMAYLEQESK